MFDQIITECTIFNPTLERAFKVAPKEFVSAYQWFIDHENSEIDKLPIVQKKDLLLAEFLFLGIPESIVRLKAKFLMD